MKHSTARGAALALLAGALASACVGAVQVQTQTAAATAPAPAPAAGATTTTAMLSSNVTWSFRVRVVSGSREGEIARGFFSVSRALIPAAGSAEVPVESFALSWAGRTMSSHELDGPARVRFVDGRPVEILAVGGPQSARFGFSQGFNRGQFGRDTEAFINEGQPYFGYLNPATFVDGAGVVEFENPG